MSQANFQRFGQARVGGGNQLRTNHGARTCKLWIAPFCVYWCVAVANAQQDPAISLARILAGKGTITAAELAQVEARPADARVGELAAILERKGVLNGAEASAFRSGGGASQGTVVTAAAPAPAPAPAQLRDLPVTTRGGPAVSLYGTLLVNAAYNTAATNIQDVPLFASKQGSDATGGDKNFGMTARQTRLGLRIRQADVAGATLTGQFEFDLFGGKTALPNGMHMDLFRLRLAFGRMDWTHAALEAGQDWALFAPLNPTSLAGFAIPDFSTSGNPWIRLPQIRGEFHTGSAEGRRLLWQVAALDPNEGDNPTTFSTSRQPGIGERGRMPALESRLAWSERVAGSDLTVGLSGHYGRGKNYAAVNGVSATSAVDSWGVALDYVLPLSQHFNLTGEAYEGRGLGIFSVAAGQSVGAPGTAGEHGVETRGGWIQAQFNPARQWQMNLGYGLEVPNASQIPVGNRWRNQSYMGNVIFKLTPSVSFAWEYRRLLTDFRGQAFANERGDHVNLAVGYVF